MENPACIFIPMLPSVQYEKVVKVKENINSGSKRNKLKTFIPSCCFQVELFSWPSASGVQGAGVKP